MLVVIMTTAMVVLVVVSALIPANIWGVFLIFGACLLLLALVLPRLVKNRGARFCSHCGRRNTLPGPDTVSCPYCGHRYEQA